MGSYFFGILGVRKILPTVGIFFLKKKVGRFAVKKLLAYLVFGSHYICARAKI